MKVKFFQKNIINIILILVILILSVILYKILYPIFSHLCFFDMDDLCSTLDPYPFMQEQNGRYVCNILSRVVVVYIPKLLGIHLQNAANTIGMFGYIIILSLLFTVSSMFYCLKDKNPIMYTLLWVLSGLFFFRYMCLVIPFYYLTFAFQYGNILAMGFALGFLLLIFRYIFIVEEEKKIPELSKNKKILLCILAFCAGNCTQVGIYDLLSSILLFYVIFLIKNKFSFSQTNRIFFNKTTIPVLISMIIGFILMITSPGLWIEVSWRHANSFADIIKEFVPFIKTYFKVVIVDYAFIYKLIALLITLNIAKAYYKKEDIKDTVFFLTLYITPLFGIFAYFFMLIFAGRTFAGENEEFWLIEPYYHFCFSYVIFSSVCLLLGHFCKNSKNYLKLIALILMFIVLNGHITFNYHSITEKINEIALEVKEYRESMYLNDKILLYSVYKGEKIFLPHNRIRTFRNIFSMPEKYLKSFYNIIFIDKIEHLDREDAIKHFNSIGGSIENDEIEQADFQKLYDLKFLLNINGE